MAGPGTLSTCWLVAPGTNQSRGPVRPEKKGPHRPGSGLSLQYTPHIGQFCWGIYEQLLSQLPPEPWALSGGCSPTTWPAAVWCPMSPRPPPSPCLESPRSARAALQGHRPLGSPPVLAQGARNRSNPEGPLLQGSMARPPRGTGNRVQCHSPNSTESTYRGAWGNGEMQKLPAQQPQGTGTLWRPLLCLLAVLSRQA